MWRRRSAIWRLVILIHRWIAPRTIRPLSYLILIETWANVPLRARIPLIRKTRLEDVRILALAKSVLYGVYARRLICCGLDYASAAESRWIIVRRLESSLILVWPWIHGVQILHLVVAFIEILELSGDSVVIIDVELLEDAHSFHHENCEKENQ